MNCLHAFDQVWYCYSLGGQFLNGTCAVVVVVVVVVVVSQLSSRFRRKCVLTPPGGEQYTAMAPLETVRLNLPTGGFACERRRTQNPPGRL